MANIFTTGSDTLELDATWKSYGISLPTHLDCIVVYGRPRLRDAIINLLEGIREESFLMKLDGVDEPSTEPVDEDLDDQPSQSAPLALF